MSSFLSLQPQPFTSVARWFAEKEADGFLTGVSICAVNVSVKRCAVHHPCYGRVRLMIMQSKAMGFVKVSREAPSSCLANSFQVDLSSY